MKKCTVIMHIIMCTCSGLVLLTSCNKANQIPPEPENNAFLEIDTHNLSFDNGENESMITINTDSGWDAEVSDILWMSAEKLNDMTLKVKVASNGLEKPERTGIVTIMPDNGMDNFEIPIVQNAGHTIAGKWKGTKIETSNDTENWSLFQNYLTSGMEVYYVFDLENNKVTLISDYPEYDVHQEVEYELSDYNPEDMTFNIVADDGTATYTIYMINQTTFEFYNYSDMLKAYQKVVCEREEAN